MARPWAILSRWRAISFRRNGATPCIEVAIGGAVLTQFVPGKGYKYYSSRTENIELVFAYAYQRRISAQRVQASVMPRPR
mgnify:CR=1 FL=1